MRRSVHQLLELSVAHLATFAFPLVFAVVCGRNLGLHDYGIVAFYTALGGFLGVVVEFGFDWLGIREVSRRPDDAAHCNEVLCNITAARLLVCGLVGSTMVAALLAWKGTAEWPLLAATAAYLVGFACDVSGYLRAREQIRLLLFITVGVRALGIVLLVWLVDAPADRAAAVWVYAFVAACTSLCAWLALHHQGLAGSPLLVARARLRGLFRDGAAILLGNLNGALLGNGGVALLGLVSDPATLGAASLALRVKMAGQAALMPLQQLSYVRTARNAEAAPAKVLHDGRRTLAVLMVCGAAIALAASVAAPLITTAVFHAPLQLPVALIMLLGLSVPIHFAGNLFGLQSLVAFGRERSFAMVLSVASACFCALLFALRGPLAYGWALLAAELVVVVGCGIVLRAVLAPRRGTP